MKKTMQCPKCSGTGDIPAFRGIAAGVCFRCNGTGQVAYRKSTVTVKPMSDHAAKIIETIKSGDLATLNYNQLNALRNSAHYPTPHCPELLEIWQERGDIHFFAAQKRKLDEFYAARA